MAHFVRIGGLQPLLKMLLDAGLLHGDCLTVTGKTVAENLANVGPYSADQDVVRPMSNPIKADSHLRVLRGNLAPDGALAKITGKEGSSFTGHAIVYESEEASLRGILDGEVKDGHVIVIRNEGPKGGPGMREMLGPTSAVMGKGMGKTVALITDGRFSGGSHGFVVGHVSPEAAVRRPARHREERRPHPHRRGEERAQPRPVGRRDRPPPQGLAARALQGKARRPGQVRQAGEVGLRRRHHRRRLRSA